MTISVRRSRLATAAVLAAALAGCAHTPGGTAMQVMPGPGKSFEVFAADQTACKTFAGGQVAGQAEAANQQAVGGAALATLIGVGAGAAIGSAGRAAGGGAAVGAGTGVATGAAIGAQSSQNAQGFIQAQYDTAYSQCMYARGNLVPGYAPAVADAGLRPTAYSGRDPALVHAVQSELDRMGYLDAAPDGVLGPHTRAAISSFERASGLPVNGAVSGRLLARLQTSPAASTASAEEAMTLDPSATASRQAPKWQAPPPVASASSPASAQASTAPTWASPSSEE
jgi:hypothetical protein